MTTRWHYRSTRRARSISFPQLLLSVTGFLKVLAIALDHRDLLVVSSDAFPLISRTDFTFAQDRQIKTAASACMKTFWHVMPHESHTEFEARHARLRHLDHRVPFVADQETV